MSKAFTFLLLVGIAAEGNAFQKWKYVGKGECMDEVGSYFNRLGDRNSPPCCYGENCDYDMMEGSYSLGSCKHYCERMGEACVGIQFYSNNKNTKNSCELLVLDGISKQSAWALAPKFCTDPTMVYFGFDSIGGVVNSDRLAPVTCWAHQTTTPPKSTTEVPSGDCGIVPRNSKIVGGDEVTPFSLPWQVALVGPSGGNAFFCGGTLIGRKHVLSAAHCMHVDPFFHDFDIILGEHDITDSNDGTRHTTSSIVSHPDYGQTYDFAVITLAEPVQLGLRAVPACLPTMSEHGGDFLDDKKMIVSGWGRFEFGGSSPTVLHKVSVPGVSNAVCQQMYEGIYGPDIIQADEMCAGNTVDGGVDACQGDSGGPLTYDDQGRSVVVGVVSWGHGCGEADYPGIYGRVTAVLPWIKEQITQI